MTTDEMRRKFDRVVEVAGQDMETIRVGGAKPALVESVSLEAYGGRMRLVEVASITAPDATQLLITPWDKGLINAIAKGIAESDLGLAANVMGEYIRIVIPPLTEERRRDLVKLVHQKLESGKLLLRQARGELKEGIEKQKGQPGVSEDDVERELIELDKETEGVNRRLEAEARAKEAQVIKI